MTVEVEIARNWHKLILKPMRRWSPQLLKASLGEIEEIQAVSVTLATEGNELLYLLEVESEASVECVAELVRGRVEWLEQQEMEEG